MSTENKLVDERPATLAEHIQLIKDTTKQAAIVPHAWLGEWLKEAERQEQTIADLRARVEAQRGPGVDQLVLRRCAYWVSLRNAPESTSSTGATVYLPKSQVFDSLQLLNLATRISDPSNPIDYVAP